MTKDNRIRLRPDVDEALTYYINEKSAVISGVPGVRMDRCDVVSEIVMNFLAAKGHYPVKVQNSHNEPRKVFGVFR